MARKFEYAVPDGFPPMSLPVDDSTRIADADIHISLVTDEADLLRFAQLNYTCFPEIWWARHEPPALRPSQAVRERRLALRALPFLHHPSFRLYKATHNSTIVGMTGLHRPRSPATPPLLPSLPPTFTPCFYRRDVADACPLPPAHTPTPAARAAAWSSTDLDTWQAEFTGHDAERARVLGDAEHWYMAPLMVDAAVRGRGVGGMLLRRAIEDAGGLPMYLEALPNARPVYYRYGFRPVQGSGAGALVRDAPEGVEVEEV